MPISKELQPIPVQSVNKVGHLFSNLKVLTPSLFQLLQNTYQQRITAYFVHLANKTVHLFSNLEGVNTFAVQFSLEYVKPKDRPSKGVNTFNDFNFFEILMNKELQPIPGHPVNKFVHLFSNLKGVNTFAVQFSPNMSSPKTRSSKGVNTFAVSTSSKYLSAKDYSLLRSFGEQNCSFIQ